MRDDFCVFILTHGRPDNQITYSTLQRYGYTGKLYFVVDDEDKTGPEYVQLYGDKVLFFSKTEAAKLFDIGDLIQKRNSVVYARNATFELARKIGCRYFVQLDDDYTSFRIRVDDQGNPVEWSLKGHLDETFSAFVDFMADTPTLSVAMSQGGDWIGGNRDLRGKVTRRKAMNSFFCDIERPFDFIGRMNDDVNTYVVHGGRGRLFFTVMHAQLTQRATQQNSGGLTEMYLEHGTYTKSFYTVMMAPSCVKISILKDNARGIQSSIRIHHSINWRNAYPILLREKWRKAKR